MQRLIQRVIIYSENWNDTAILADLQRAPHTIDHIRPAHFRRPVEVMDYRFVLAADRQGDLAAGSDLTERGKGAHFDRTIRGQVQRVRITYRQQILGGITDLHQIADYRQ